MKWLNNVAAVCTIAYVAMNSAASYGGKYGPQKSAGNNMSFSRSQQVKRMNFSSSKPLPQKFSSDNLHSMQTMNSNKRVTSFGNSQYKLHPSSSTRNMLSGTPNLSNSQRHTTSLFQKHYVNKHHSQHKEDHHGHHHHHHQIPWWAVMTISRPQVVVSRPIVLSQPIITERQAAFFNSEEPKSVLPELVPGMQATIGGSKLGESTGQVLLRINELTMPLEVVNWTNDMVTVQLPSMAVATATAAQIAVVRTDGTLARTIDVKLTAQTSGKL